MAVQLDKVSESEHQGKVMFHVVPFDAGAHATQDSNFVLFEFDQWPVVFVKV